MDLINTQKKELCYQLMEKWQRLIILKFEIFGITPKIKIFLLKIK